MSCLGRTPALKFLIYTELYMRVAGFDNPVTFLVYHKKGTFLVLSFMNKTNCQEESLDVTIRTISQCKLQH
jgi:hypothetical protein